MEMIIQRLIDNLNLLLNDLNKENNKLEKTNNELRLLYRRTANKLLENGNDEMARYFLAQINEVPTFTVDTTVDYYEEYHKIISSDVTNKYKDMIEAFECDFSLPYNSNDFSLFNDLADLIKHKSEVLCKDIELLEELSFGLRHGTLKIYEIGEENENGK